MDSHFKKQKIYSVLIKIPHGRVVSYGNLAKMAGLGSAARYVGNVLRQLPKDTTLPWHRVVNSQGKISLAPHHPGYELQLQRLKQEGIIIRNGKIDMKTHSYGN